MESVAEGVGAGRLARQRGAPRVERSPTQLPVICPLNVWASALLPEWTAKSVAPGAGPATATPPSAIAGAALRARCGAAAELEEDGGGGRRGDRGQILQRRDRPG